MQPSSREMQMQSLNTLLNHQQQSQMSPMLPFDTSSSHDDFLEQMFSSLNNPSPNWPPSDTHHHLKTADEDQSEYNNNNNNHFEDDQSSFMTSKLRHHQINNGGGSAKALMLQQQQLMLSSRGLNGNGLRSPTASGEHNHLLQMPLSLTTDDHNDGNNDTSVQALFNGFSNGSLGQTSTSPPPHFGAVKQAAPPNGSTGAGTSTQPRQQRVRARRGQATDPHSIAERLRRERIAERMKALQELVPNGNKTDKASMLDEIIDYVKFLQLQVKVLSMSRLGGAATVTPLVGDVSSEVGPRSNGTQSASPPSNNDNSSTAVTEQQVAKLMEEDMGSAMQYLQGKGLCLMPISLATAISTATHSRNPMNFNTMLGPNTDANGGGPTSPNTSVLTVQSTTIANGGDVSTKVKDAVSVSK